MSFLLSHAPLLKTLGFTPAYTFKFYQERNADKTAVLTSIVEKTVEDLKDEVKKLNIDFKVVFLIYVIFLEIEIFRVGSP